MRACAVLVEYGSRRRSNPSERVDVSRARARTLGLGLVLGATHLGCVIPISSTTPPSDNTTPDGGPAGTGGVDSGPVVPGSWTAVTDNLTGTMSSCGNLGYVSSKPDEDMMIAGVATQGLYASTHGAASWTHLGQAPGSDPITNRTSQMLYDPTNRSVFWEAGAYGSCVYQTNDDGATFKTLGNVQHCDSIGVDFTDPMRQTMLAGAHEGHSVYRSVDGGKNWVDVGAGIPMSAGYTGFAYVASPQIHLVGTWNNAAMSGIYRTTDGGKTWARVFSAPFRSPPLVVGNTMYWMIDSSENDAGIVKSTDQGITWSRIAGSEGVVSGTHGIVTLPDGQFVALGKSSVIASADHGATWTNVSPPLPFVADGLAYSSFRKMLFISYWECNAGNNPVAPNAIMTFGYP